MTGFGAATSTSGAETVSIELKSVNHKFCEVKARLPREFTNLENIVTKIIKDRCPRGAFDVVVRRASRSANGSVPTVDLELAKEYRAAYADLARALQLPDTTSIRDIASQSGVIRLEEARVDLEAATRALEEALNAAIDALLAMRNKEGAALHADLSSRLGLVQQTVHELRELAPAAVLEYQSRLQERIAELARGVPVDAQRLAQEVAFFAERTDVAEEMTRLESHLVQFRGLLAAAEPVGRKMDFLVQELHREVNTTGSKSQHAGISSRVMGLKAELERIREQVQNVE